MEHGMRSGRSIKYVLGIGLIGLLTLSLTPAVQAEPEPSPQATIRQALEPRLNKAIKINAITQTPYNDLYEINVDDEIYYTDKKAKYLFVGHIFDLSNFQDYTKARLEEINRMQFSDLPLDAALKVVKGNGKRVIAIFEDPNCGYCKRLRRTLQKLDNVTIYTFMLNILSPDSIEKSRAIWCSAKPAQAWDDWMLENKIPAPAPVNCNAPHEKIVSLAKKLHITGTPTIFFTDGSRLGGAADLETLEAKLATIK